MEPATNEQWAKAIAERIRDEGPWDDANEHVSALVLLGLKAAPEYIDLIRGTMLIEDDYFLQTRTVPCKVCGGSIVLVGLTEERNDLGHKS